MPTINILFIPDSFNTTISHQFLNYKLIKILSKFKTREHKFKGNLYSKLALYVLFKDFLFTKINLSQKYIL